MAQIRVRLTPRAAREQIAAAGFKKGTINDFSDQQLAEVAQTLPKGATRPTVHNHGQTPNR